VRILHAIRSDAFAGVERHVTRLAAAQAARGDRVAVVGGDPDRMRAVLDEHGVLTLPAMTVSDVARQVRSAMTGADVVHTHMTAAELGATAAAWAGGRRTLGVPMVTTRHFARPRGSGPLRRPTAALARSRVRTQIAISSYVAQHIDGESVVVYPGVDRQPDGPRSGEREHVVLVVQRLEPEKATDVALRAFAELPAPGWRLLVAGNGSQRAPLEALAARLGIAGSVQFLGARDDVEALMRRAAVLLAPCPVEGLGLTVLEAMAAGLPVVASAAGGHLETIGTVSRDVLFPPGEVGAAATVLAALTADPARRDDLADAGLACQRDGFTLEAQVAATDAVYRGALR